MNWRFWEEQEWWQKRQAKKRAEEQHRKMYDQEYSPDDPDNPEPGKVFHTRTIHKNVYGPWRVWALGMTAYAILATVGFIWMAGKEAAAKQEAESWKNKYVACANEQNEMKAEIVDLREREAERAQAKSDFAIKLELGTGGKGDGVQHTFIRQIEADPQYFGYVGSASDDAAIRKFAANKAHQLATKFGFYDWKFGSEIWIAQPDQVAFVLEKDSAGNFICKKFVKGADGAFPDSPQKIYHAAGSVQQSEFLAQADEDGNYTLSESYLYVAPLVLQ